MNISRKKPSYPIQVFLRQYLQKFERVTQLPVTYWDLLRYADAFPLLDKHGKDTFWETVVYAQHQVEELYKGLVRVYAILKTNGDMSVMEHLYVDRIDYCTFGNSNPFRVRVVNQYNDNYDYFYVKKADASRVYGLEMEHLLSPNRINYLVYQDTLIEEHIAGVPGDTFIKNYIHRPLSNKVRICKEFIKFNERCSVVLLGDMRAYNYVVDITPDFENEQYRVRPIDFDQQSYEGNRKMYLPQFFKENNEVVQLCLKHINLETARQYQYEEQTLLARRLRVERYRIKELMDCMRKDTISTPEKISQLKQELAFYHQNNRYLRCHNMGDILTMNMKTVLAKIHMKRQF
jgi:hypothetical protein